MKWDFIETILEADYVRVAICYNRDLWPALAIFVGTLC